MNNIIRKISDCNTTIEHIRDCINSGRCNNCRQFNQPCKEIKPLVESLTALCNSIKSANPFEEERLTVLSERIENQQTINPYDFGGVMAVVNIIASQYDAHNRKKIFISHSSEDKELIGKFCDHILQLGIGISHDDIFCTSIEEMAIENGEDIRKHIHNNIRYADFSFLLISENYKKSEICINEMGAVWAYDNNVRYYLLPNSNFDKIGWLCDTKKAEKINNTIALDALQKELISFYTLPDKGIAWSRQRESFLSCFK